MADAKRIEEQAQAFAEDASAANFSIGVEVVGIDGLADDKHPQLLARLFPSIPYESQPKVIPFATATDATSALAETIATFGMVKFGNNLLAQRLLTLVKSPNAQYFQLVTSATTEPRTIEPQPRDWTYWNFWLLVVDREMDRCLAMDLLTFD